LAGSHAQARRELAGRLRRRRAEIRQALLARAHGLSGSDRGLDHEYLQGLEAAVAGALDYAIGTVEAGDARPLPVPAVILEQARLAARYGVGIETVLHRYFAGFTLVGSFILEEAGDDLPGGRDSLHLLLQTQSARFDRVIHAVVEEYNREAAPQRASGEQLRAERVKRLLGGEAAGAPVLGYSLQGWHLGVVLQSTNAEVLQHLAGRLERRLLRVCPGEGLTWAWLGGRDRLDSREALDAVRGSFESDPLLALGEAGHGVEGWRRTHQQARAALSLMRQRGASVRYAEVALVVSTRRDELLASHLRQTYLKPLSGQRDGGGSLKRTLRAYLSTGHNVSSAAAALGVSRHTVSARLRLAEELVGQPLHACAAELEIALRLDPDVTRDSPAAGNQMKPPLYSTPQSGEENQHIAKADETKVMRR
jgi:hypothetical protein